MELWSEISKTYDSVKKAQTKQVSLHKLTVPQFSVLEVLRDNGPMPLRRISEHLLVTGANITCVVDNLERDKLAMRVPSLKDRRIIMAELTNKGKEKVERILPEYVKNLSEITSKLTDEEKRILYKLLQKLNQ